MSGNMTPRRIAAFAVAVFALLWTAPGGNAADNWQVPEASFRYKLELAKKPSHPTSGYYVHLPDGGILGGEAPLTIVMGEDGKQLPSYLLWQNPESGFSMVFADPGGSVKSVYVYVRTDRPAQYWTPETGLTPSAILCANPGRDSIATAKALAKMGRVEADVHDCNKGGINRAPLSIGGDELGLPRPGSFYLLSYVSAKEDGKYWIAPFFLDGVCEILIDGKKLTPRQRVKKWGGDGEWFDLDQGLHRFEIFQTAPGTGPYDSTKKGGGLMFMTWREPKDVMKEVETHVVDEWEIARSGACKLDRIDAKDGGPVACAQVHAGLTYWFGDEDPLIICDLQALKDGNPPDTTFTWTLPEGATLEGDSIQWLFPGCRGSRVKLVAKSGKKVSQCVIPFVAFSTQKTSLEEAPIREAFRNVLTGMLTAYPHNPDPVAAWSDAYWNNLLRTIDAGEGFSLMNQLLTDRWEIVRKKLNPEQQATIQDVFLDMVQRDDPAAALKWLDKFQLGTGDFDRRNELKLREAEIKLYYLGDTKAAEQVLAPLVGLSNDIGDRAKIRMGDLAFIEGDLNKATGYYAELQNRARMQRNAAGTSSGGQLVESGAARPPTAPDWRSSPLPFQSPPKDKDKDKDGPRQGRSGALLEVSLSENVRTLLDDGYYVEARQALRTWEREFPLSKVSGDFIMRESELYMKLHDFKRARPMLEAYCREIDASSFLPDAARKLITCVKESKESPDSIRGIIEKVKGRLKYHPVAQELDDFLAGK